jgi:hypothetical protein
MSLTQRPFHLPGPPCMLHTPHHQIKLSGDRVLPLIRFRGAVRPVIVAGERGYVERAIKAAEGQLINLRARGVSGEGPLRCQPSLWLLHAVDPMLSACCVMFSCTARVFWGSCTQGHTWWCHLCEHQQQRSPEQSLSSM